GGSVSENGAVAPVWLPASTEALASPVKRSPARPLLGVPADTFARTVTCSRPGGLGVVTTLTVGRGAQGAGGAVGTGVFVDAAGTAVGVAVAATAVAVRVGVAIGVAVLGTGTVGLGVAGGVPLPGRGMGPAV